MPVAEAANFTAASAPWWFVAALAGGLTIISTAGGAAISFVSARSSDKRKADQDRIRREFDVASKTRDEIRVATATMLVEARQFLRDYRDNFDRHVPSDGSAAHYLALAAPKRLDIRPAYSAYWILVLVGDEAIGAAARELLKATREFDVQITPGGLSPLSNDRFKQLYDRHIAARGVLIETVKARTGALSL